MLFYLSLVSFGVEGPGLIASGMVLGLSVSLGAQDPLCRGLNDGSTLDGWQSWVPDAGTRVCELCLEGSANSWVVRLTFEPRLCELTNQVATLPARATGCGRGARVAPGERRNRGVYRRLR